MSNPDEPFGSSSPPPPPPSYGTPPPGSSSGAPPPPTYGAPGSGSPSYGAPAKQTNGLAIAALVCGVLSMVCIPPLGFVAVPLGIVAMGRARKMGGNGKGLAIGGLVTGIVGILVTIALVIIFVFAADDISDEIDSDPIDGVCNEERVLQDPDC